MAHVGHEGMAARSLRMEGGAALCPPPSYKLPYKLYFN